MRISRLLCFAFALVLCQAYGAEVESEDLEAELNSEVEEFHGGRPKRCKGHDDCRSSYQFCIWKRCRIVRCYSDWRCKGYNGRCDKQKRMCTKGQKPTARPTRPRPTRPTRPRPTRPTHQPFCRKDEHCDDGQCCMSYGGFGFCRPRPKPGQFCFPRGGCECTDGYECRRFRCKPEEGSGSGDATDESENESDEDED